MMAILNDSCETNQKEREQMTSHGDKWCLLSMTENLLEIYLSKAFRCHSLLFSSFIIDVAIRFFAISSLNNIALFHVRYMNKNNILIGFFSLCLSLCLSLLSSTIDIRCFDLTQSEQISTIQFDGNV